MPIPEFDPDTGYLPAGDHPATLDELRERFGDRYGRRKLLDALERVVSELREKGVETIWVDGGFVTDAPRPSDIDVIYKAPPGVDVSEWGLLSPARREDLKDLEDIDLWLHPSYQRDKNNPFKRVTIQEWMSTDKEDTPKGMILLVEDDADVRNEESHEQGTDPITEGEDAEDMSKATDSQAAEGRADD